VAATVSPLDRLDGTAKPGHNTKLNSQAKPQPKKK